MNRGMPDEFPPAADARSVFVSASDGLRLHVRACGPRRSQTLPVLCLPGLSRDGRDFEALAQALAGDRARPRRVYALDARGRGLSAHDRNPANYSLPVELDDVVSVLTALDARPAILVGTSRGGILTMLLAAAQPGAIAGAVLNDIGPAIEGKGVLRIKGYLGKLPRPATFEEGAEILRRLFSAQFTRFGAEDWLALARRSWLAGERGEPLPSYDPRLARTLDSVDAERPLPALWAQFGALARVPVMAIRGENSDLLSVQTLAAMKAQRPDLVAVEVAGEGHPPVLEGRLIGAIADFAARCDAAHAHG